MHVHALRNALGADRILTRAPGYMLRLEEGESDVERFEQLVAAGQPREALALWRGPALADVASEPFAQPEAARLEEARLGALEARIAADLDAGRHDALAAELEALVAGHPHRERLRAHQMLALYRSGRQADALAAYRDARAALDELGLEPSTELRTLEQQILRQDPALVPLVPREAPPPTGRHPVAELVGRALEVAAICSLLERDDTRLVTLTGAGGTGKTSLALAVARQLAGADAVVVELGPISEPDLVATTIAKALEIDEEPGRAVEETLAESVADLDRLLVIDNFEHLLGAAEVVGTLLRSGPALRVLVTSRAPLHLTAEHEYQVAPLRIPEQHETTVSGLEGVESVRLFVQRRAAMPGFELSDDNAAAVARICRALDGLPLAIELAAARIRVLGPDGIAKRIGERLALLTRSRPRPRGAPTITSCDDRVELRLLDEPARRRSGPSVSSRRLRRSRDRARRRRRRR